jgi:hypothetical protein
VEQRTIAVRMYCGSATRANKAAIQNAGRAPPALPTAHSHEFPCSQAARSAHPLAHTLYLLKVLFTRLFRF